jgi:iron complex outermembrane recepter protein
MKKIIYILLVVLTIYKSASANAQFTFIGKIIDAKTSQPIVGATIHLHDTKIITTSSNSGVFKIPQINAGVYLLEISHIGYASIIENVTINAAFDRTFYLTPTVAEQEAVVVTGVSSATKIRNSSQPISVVTKNDFNKISSTNLVDAIAKAVSGVSSISTGPAIAKPVIRGLGFNRLVTIHDGVRQEGQQWGEEHGLEIDENSIQRVEVLKGAASLMYGSDAMAGVLNLMGYQPVQQGTAKGNIGLGFLDNSGMFNAHANYAANYTNGFNFNIYGSHKSAGDYKNKYDGTVLNSRFLENNFGASFGVQKRWGYSQIFISSVNQKMGVVEGSRDSATGKFLLYAGEPEERIANNDDLKSRDFTVPFQKIGHLKVTSNSSFILKKGKLNTTFSFQKNTREEYGHLPISDHGDVHLDLKTIGYNVQYHLNEKNGFNHSIGINGMQQSNHSHVEGDHAALIPNYHLFDFGIFAVTRKSFKKGVFTAGIRFDNRSLHSEELKEGTATKFAANERNYSNVSGSIGLSYFLSNQTTLKINVAKGFRAPTVTELSSNGAHEGTFRYEIGDANLKAENSYQFDAGIEHATDHVSFNGNLFFNSIKNFIYASKLFSVNGGDSLMEHDGDFETVYKYKQANAFLYGFEASIDVHPHPLDWLHFKNTFSYVRGNFVQSVQGTNNLPLIPQPRLLTELRADVKKIGNSFTNAYFKIEADNFFAQNSFFSAFNTETSTSAFTLFNAGFGADILRNKKVLMNVYFSANNLADVAFQNHLSRLKYTDANNATGRNGVFNMGRNFSVKVNIPLQFTVK